MALLDPPPPRHLPHPQWHEIRAGSHIVRLFNPGKHDTKALSFRYKGPYSRFDHHRWSHENPQDDSERGIYYAAPDGGLSCCVVEIFGDTRVIKCAPWLIARPRLTRTLRLLDLRGPAAMRAGTIAAVAKGPHPVAQKWSRHFYDAPEYGSPDGLIYHNAHNDEEAIALYERAANALICPEENILPLCAEELRYPLLEIAERNNLDIIPY